MARIRRSSTDLITGIHGEDPAKLYAELCEAVEDVIHHFESEKRALPPARVRSLRPGGGGGLREDVRELHQHIDFVHRDLLEAIGRFHEKVIEAIQVIATVVEDLRSRVEILERKVS
jgi:hypothetical protein